MHYLDKSKPRKSRLFILKSRKALFFGEGVMKVIERVLTDEKKEELARHIEKNGGAVIDPEFKELDIYLQNNPPGSELKYLDN